MARSGEGPNPVIVKSGNQSKKLSTQDKALIVHDSILLRKEKRHIEEESSAVKRNRHIVEDETLERALQLDTRHQRLLPPGTFTNLKELKISWCRGLSYLFLPSIEHELQRLERLELKDNEAMEELVAEENGVELEKGAFPPLKDLLLINLSKLTSFYRGASSNIS
uniref:Uncharacterized protein LOC105052079 n=1 Tax=Elaeis guineensis var. tenera TaxID=51953 RepID=A0A6J0PAG8_ELAGV|nr:uncharacterized protein LOC105052079 [Elaeis guineensis]XP_019701976.1 uncharacterized protein LOC105052079 [Elaeis guineensis]